MEWPIKVSPPEPSSQVFWWFQGKQKLIKGLHIRALIVHVTYHLCWVIMSFKKSAFFTYSFGRLIFRLSIFPVFSICRVFWIWCYFWYQKKSHSENSHQSKKSLVNSPTENCHLEYSHYTLPSFMEEVLSEERQLMKWVETFQVWIFQGAVWWVGTFRVERNFLRIVAFIDYQISNILAHIFSSCDFVLTL